MTRRLSLAGAALALLLAAWTPVPGAAAELVMYEEHGCIYCERWNREIADAYPKTPEGQAAPLRRIAKHEPRPDDIRFDGPLVYTPTFVLVEDGEELARIEGYPGEDFFWGLLGMLLKTHLDFEGTS